MTTEEADRIAADLIHLLDQRCTPRPTLGLPAHPMKAILHPRTGVLERLSDWPSTAG
ncbi:hypothetical protein [Streptomyces roseifaciens]|uniref:hypothetical protein n=1 Tax=Streptomyces roseifaciens TaxID=1488406 RepID=UPI000AC8A6D9|nr:hypothetical protein [Streptomyces roseifaciens]